jgi:alkane 1-monooxygenase
MLLHLLLPLGFTLSPLFGWLIDWPWLTVLLATVVLPLAEWMVGRERSDAASINYRWPVWFLRAVMLAVLMICAGFALLAAEMTWSQLIPMALGCGYVAGGIGIVLAHELGHRRPAIDRALARALLCSIAYGHYVIEHNRGHHRAAATRTDAATARREESVWRFMPRYFFYVFVDAVKLSRAKRGNLNEAIALAVITALMALLLFVAGGWQSTLFAIITGATAQFLVAAIDYVEHWGLERQTIDGKPERMGPQHTWDCANRVSDALLFNLPRHSAHHLEPSLDCNDLPRTPASPQMPTGYAGMTILAAVSPLYRWIMTPRLPDALPEHRIDAAPSSHFATGDSR